MSDKRPRIAVDVDDDLREFIEVEKAQVEVELRVKLSDSKAVAMLLRRYKDIVERDPSLRPRIVTGAIMALFIGLQAIFAPQVEAMTEVGNPFPQKELLASLVILSTWWSYWIKRRQEEEEEALDGMDDDGIVEMAA